MTRTIRRTVAIAPLAAALVTWGAGCASQPKLGPEDFEPATRVVERTEVAEIFDVEGGYDLLASESPVIRDAIEEFRKTGNAPVVSHRRGGFVTFPFGESQPILYCKPLRVCEIELQAGEDVLDVALGDAVRWHAEKMESGPRQARVPHLIVKPTDFDVSTNLVITTSRRVYHLGLIATKEEKPFYYRSARFYYPHELVAQWKTAAARAADEQRSERAEVVERGLTLRPDELNFGYEVSGDKTLWRPSQVFDDGTRVYLRMPASMSVTEAPALFVLSAGGEKALVNYRLRGVYYVVDRLFERAVLVLGVGRHQERVEIARLGAEEEKSRRRHRSRRPGGRPGR